MVYVGLWFYFVCCALVGLSAIEKGRPWERGFIVSLFVTPLFGLIGYEILKKKDTDLEYNVETDAFVKVITVALIVVTFGIMFLL